MQGIESSREAFGGLSSFAGEQQKPGKVEMLWGESLPSSLCMEEAV